MPGDGRGGARQWLGVGVRRSSFAPPSHGFDHLKELLAHPLVGNRVVAADQLNSLGLLQARVVLGRALNEEEGDWNTKHISAEAGSRLQLAMPAGAICVFLGTLLHGGGANCTGAPRLAFTNQYCEPWARPQENFFLGVPPKKVRGMSREMQILLGYALLPPSNIMGQVSGYHPIKALAPDFVPPVLR